MLRRASLLVVALAAAFAPAQYPGATPPPYERGRGFNAISVKDARAFLGYLAGPQTEGRGTGQPGYQKAAVYVAAKFRQLGLKPVGDKGTFFQNVPFVRTRARPGATLIQIEGTPVRLTRDAEISFAGLRRDLNVAAPVSFVVSSSEEASLPETNSLEGKAVIVVGKAAGRRLRFQLLRSKAAVILHTAPSLWTPNDWAVGRAAGGGRADTRPPVGYLRPAAAMRLARAMGAGNGTEIYTGGFPSSTTAGVASPQGKLKVVAKLQQERIEVPNVVGLLPGRDPTLKAEVIGIGAHLDHLGKQGKTIYYGADDDGSGSTALLLVAKAMAANPKKPRRSILFMAFCGEEMGLIGSRYYAENPIFPHEKMIAELQMDMVGRNEETATEPASDNVDTIHLVGSKRISTDLHRIVEEQNRHLNFKFEYDEEDVYTRSDHYAFAAKGIPIAFLFDGFHPDYHQPTDTVEKINYQKIVSAARLFYLVAQELANRDERPTKDVAAGL